MEWPWVSIHNLVSLDGRLSGFPADTGLYYEIAARLPHQAVLTGSGTLLAAAGAGLNAALLRAGLADEISVILAPYLAAGGAGGPHPFAVPGSGAAHKLEPAAIERLREGHLWLRYSLRGGQQPGAPEAP